ncbi:MAG TPA: spore coat protein YutH [Bacillus bacterium]|nr:spore coat protein YutH [Bacillus sp. (in: firmicutes)]
MMERDLFEQYRLNSNQYVRYRNYNAFYEKGDLYVIVPIPHLEKEELLEIKQISDFLLFQKEDRIAMFMPTVTGELVGNINNGKVVIYKMPRLNRRKMFTDGEELARFHALGRLYPYPPKTATRLGLWKSLWESRLTQLENWWGQKVREIPANRFEKLFFDSFPYYLGLSENAIQYVADSIWDDERQEMQTGTICHVKYKGQIESDMVIFPTELTYDHPSRDLAEWIRHKFAVGFDLQEMRSFLYHYEKRMPLSPTSRRMLFARLLFPVPYFELIEGYYTASTEDVKKWYEKNFIHYVEETERYEQFLRTFFKNISLSTRNKQIPKIEWLQGVKF